jgi:hypothetical protein
MNVLHWRLSKDQRRALQSTGKSSSGFRSGGFDLALLSKSERCAVHLILGTEKFGFAYLMKNGRPFRQCSRRAIKAGVSQMISVEVKHRIQDG